MHKNGVNTPTINKENFQENSDSQKLPDTKPPTKAMTKSELAISERRVRNSFAIIGRPHPYVVCATGMTYKQGKPLVKSLVLANSNRISNIAKSSENTV